MYYRITDKLNVYTGSSKSDDDKFIRFDFFVKFILDAIADYKITQVE